MGCMGSTIINGIPFETCDDLPVQAEQFFFPEDLEEKLEKQFIYYKNRNRRAQREYKRQLKDLTKQMKNNLKETKKTKKVNNLVTDNVSLNDAVYGSPDSGTFCNTSMKGSPSITFNSLRIRRCSSFNFDELCVHCEHSHLYDCCKYYGDTTTDAIDYAIFKVNLEKSREVPIKNFLGIPEILCGQILPSNFPKWSYKNARLYRSSASSLKKTKKSEISDGYWKEKKSALEKLSSRLMRLFTVIV